MRRQQSHFNFKKFTIYHDRCTMKVGTDGVLLGAWAKVDAADNILDIGSGSGIISLMLAQRTSPSILIDAVEIETEDAQQARENILQSPWYQRIKMHQDAIQNYHPDKKYDLIISNPPYFQNSFKPPDPKRGSTRHTVLLPFTDLIVSVKRLIAHHGTFNVILPYQEGLEFIHIATQSKMYCTRQWSLRTRQEKQIERWLLEFSNQNSGKEEGEMILYDASNKWSEAYKQLTKDFYLNI